MFGYTCRSSLPILRSLVLYGNAGRQNLSVFHGSLAHLGTGFLVLLSMHKRRDTPTLAWLLNFQHGNDFGDIYSSDELGLANISIRGGVCYSNIRPHGVVEF